MDRIPAVRIASVLLIALVRVFPVSGQERGREDDFGPALTADALAAAVLEANAGLAAAEAAAEQAAYRVAPAGSLEDPTLNYGIAPRSSEQSVDFTQRIPWPGTLRAREAAARHEASAAGWNVGAKRLALAAAAKSAYAEWYFLERGLEIHHQVQALLEELIVTAETRYAAGRALRQDVLQAEIENAELETAELRLLRERTATLARINALLNRSPGSSLPPATGIPIVLPALDSEALGQLALARHPVLGGLDAEIAAAGSRVTVARKAFFPSFQLRAGYNSLWDDSEKRPMLGLSINIPFDRSKRESELGRARAELRRAEWTLSDERARLLADVVRVHAEVLESVETIDVHENEIVPLADAYLDAAIVDYRSGAGGFLNVVMAERRLLTSRLELERTRADYLRRIAELEHLTGGQLETVDRRGEQQ